MAVRAMALVEVAMSVPMTMAVYGVAAIPVPRWEKVMTGPVHRAVRVMAVRVGITEVKTVSVNAEAETVCARALRRGEQDYRSQDLRTVFHASAHDSLRGVDLRYCERQHTAPTLNRN